MRRFGFAIRIGGDPEISGALAAGIERGTTPLPLQPSAVPPGRCAKPSAAPEGEGSGAQGNPARMANSRADVAVRRVNMMRHTPQEWAEMTEEARVLYGGRRYLPRWAERLLVGYAMICMGVSWLYHQQEKILQ